MIATFRPAMAYANAIKIKSPLGKCILYDTLIEHKNGDDPDSFGAILTVTKSEVGDQVPADSAERTWLKTFLNTRMSVLIEPHNKMIRNEWKDSQEKVAFFLWMIRVNDLNLDEAIEINTINFSETIS